MDEMREQRKIVTALFADLVGSTALAESLDPEDVRDLLAPAIEHIIGAVTAFGGTVKDLAGDGVLALFGAPIAHEDDQERAVRAGLQIVDRISEYSAAAARAFGTTIGVRVGIETGLAVLGSVGAFDRREYGAVGDVVNTAARLQSAAEPQTVLVGGGARRGIEHLFDWVRVPDLVLKGKSQPLAGWQPVGPTSVAFPPDPVQSGPRAPLTARDAELAQLRGVLQSARHGHGAVVVVTGEPGTGKTRLVEEGRRVHGRLPGRSVSLEGRCASYGQATPLAPYRHALAQWLGTDQTPPSAEAAAVANQRSRAVLGDEHDSVGPFLLRLLELPCDPAQEAQIRDLTPELLQRRVFEAVLATVRRLSSDAGAVIVLEDLQWADPTSIELTGRLLALTESLGLVVVLTLRTDPDTAGWRLLQDELRNHPTRVLHIPLSSLRNGEDEALLTALVGPGVLPPSLERQVLDAAEGNPFYLEEMVRSLEDAGALARGPEGYRFDHRADVQVPPTVQRVILARTDLLDKDCHDTIAAASVVGRRFGLPVLTSVLDGDVPVKRTVGELCRLDLLRPAGPDLFEFKHGLIQDTVYRSLLVRRRKTLHERVGRALERGSVEPTGELARELGRHFAAAELADEAVLYLASAAEQARQEYANEEALGMLTTAISQAERALSREEPGRWADVVRDLEERVGSLHDLIADFSSARSSYQRALTLTGADDALRQARLHRRIAQTWTLQRRYDDAIGALDAADSALRNVADQAEKWQEVIAAGLGRAEITYWLNDTDRLSSVLTALRGVVDAHGTPRQRADFYWQAVTWANRSNRFVTTDAVVRDALAAFRATLELGDPDSTAWGHFHLGMVLLWKGDLDRAEAELQSALRFADESGTVLLQARCLCYLTVAARRRVDLGRAAALVERTERAAFAAGLLEYTAAAKATRSWLAWRHGQVTSAEQLAADALDIWQSLPVHYPFHWMALWPLTAVAVADQRTPEALDHVRAMLAEEQQLAPPALRALMTQAVEWYEQGGAAEAGMTLQRAFRLAAHDGFL